MTLKKPVKVNSLNRCLKKHCYSYSELYPLQTHQLILKNRTSNIIVQHKRLTRCLHTKLLLETCRSGFHYPAMSNQVFNLEIAPSDVLVHGGMAVH